jgi:lipoprotein-anchoring transpeptidase ErfK/SrfK
MNKLNHLWAYTGTSLQASARPHFGLATTSRVQMKITESFRPLRMSAPKFATRPTRLMSGVVISAVLFAGGIVAPAQAQDTTTTTGATTSTTTSTTTPPVGDSSSTTAVSSTTGVSTTGVSTTVPTSSTTAPASTVPASTSVPASTTTTTLVPGIVIPPGKVLTVGSRGKDVLALEEKLEELMYDTGKVDGRFDWSTWQGVVAFQKYEGLKRTGKVDNKLRLLIQNGRTPVGKITNGPATRLEVNKEKQLTFMYVDGSLYRVLSVSTGNNKKYCDWSRKAQRQVCGTAVTPPGRFKIQRRINGWRESDLGRLYNPLYFNGGIAFHGAPSVPAYPASHGCVRLPMPIAEWFPKVVKNGTAVYVYEK